MAKRKRRANGEGTVFRVKDGRWGAALWVTYPSGHRKRQCFYSRDRTKCLNWLAEKRVQHAHGQLGSGDDITLIAWLYVWLDRYTPNIRLTTRTNYTGYIRNHVEPSKIGNTKLTKLTVDHLQRFANGLSVGENALSAKTVRNLFQMLHAALKQAEGNGLISRNPADFVQLPRIEQPDIETISDDEIARLLAVSRNDKYHLALVLLLFCGLRLGELLALRHSSICEAEGVTYLKIEHSLNRVTNEDSIGNDDAPKTMLVLGEPKSKNSNREIPLLPEVQSVLDTHIARQNERAENAYGLFEEDSFLISNELGGFIDPTTFRSWFNKTVEAAGISRHIRIHDCRHTAATLMLRSGMTPHEVALILGHSSSQITERVYLHPTVADRNKAITSMTQTVTGFLSTI